MIEFHSFAELQKGLISEAAATVVRRKRSPCPRVGVFLATRNDDSSWGVFAKSPHLLEKRGERETCVHAEEVAIRQWHESDNHSRKVRDSAILLTTLEPCTKRTDHQTSCADRIVGSGIRKVIVGMLDPDPEIYGYGVTRLRENGVDVDYLPRGVREAAIEGCRDFVVAKVDRFHNSEHFDDLLPRVITEHNRAGYLSTAHALFRMYSGDRVTWFYPKLPSLADRDKFQAWWAQGLFANESVTRVDVVVRETDLRSAVKLSQKSKGMLGESLLDRVLEESKGRPVQVHAVPSPNHKNQQSLMLFHRGGVLEYAIRAVEIPEFSGPQGGAKGLWTYVVLHAGEGPLAQEVDAEVRRVWGQTGQRLDDALRERMSSSR